MDKIWLAVDVGKCQIYKSMLRTAEQALSSPGGLKGNTFPSQIPSQTLTTLCISHCDQIEAVKS